jgi:hypothetical protein
MLPNLLIIGAPKAGTTSLHAYLAQHPEISMSEPKELRYFWRHDWKELRNWYESHFDPNKPIRGESTPAYTMWPHRDHVPERAAELVPAARLIYVVRDPIDRIISHFRQRIADGFPDPLEHYLDELESPDNPVVCPSRYGTQLDRWLRHFEKGQILVVDQHELKHDRDRVMREVLGFLGVEPIAGGLDLERELNRAGEQYAFTKAGSALTDLGLWRMSNRVPERVKAPLRSGLHRLVRTRLNARIELDEVTRSRLVGHLRPEVKRLRELTGQTFASWSL